MVDILFIAQNTHQYNYFKKIQQNLDLQIEVCKLNHLCYKKIIDVDLSKKKEEIFIKYSPLKAKLYFQYVKFITPFFECNYEYFIKKYNPKAVGVWNGIKYPQNILVKIAKKYNKKLIYFENGFLPDTTQVDCKGVNYYNSLPRDIEFYKNLKLDIKLDKKLQQRKFVGKQILEDVELPNQYIFVPFQVAYDSQLIYFSDINMKELFFLIKQISERLKINFVFKEHPSDRVSDYSHLHQIAKKSKYIMFANKIDTQTLIQNSKGVVTINSSVGIESLLFHKKVYVLGKAFYRIDGITIACDKNNLEEKLNDDIKIDFDIVDNFLKYLKIYLVPKNWKTPDEVHFLEVEKRILECLQ